MLIAIEALVLLLFARANEKTFTNCQSLPSQQFKIEAGKHVPKSKFNNHQNITFVYYLLKIKLLNWDFI